MVWQLLNRREATTQHNTTQHKNFYKIYKIIKNIYKNKKSASTGTYGGVPVC